MVPSLSSVSDHYMVECKSLLGVTEESVKEQPPKASALDNLNFFSNDIDWEVISAQFEDIDWSQVLEGLSPQDQLNLLMKKIVDICKANIPLKKSARSGKPKIPRDRRILMRKRKKISVQLEFQLSDARRKKLQRKLVDIELSLQKSHFASKIANENRAIGAIKNNSKYFFSYAKNILHYLAKLVSF